MIFKIYRKKVQNIQRTRTNEKYEKRHKKKHLINEHIAYIAKFRTRNIDWQKVFDNIWLSLDDD